MYKKVPDVKDNEIIFKISLIFFISKPIIIPTGVIIEKIKIRYITESFWLVTLLNFLPYYYKLLITK